MDSLTHVGLDVHKESTAVAVLRPEAVEPENRVITSTPETYRKLVSRVGVDGVVFCNEAGSSLANGACVLHFQGI